MDLLRQLAGSLGHQQQQQQLQQQHHDFQQEDPNSFEQHDSMQAAQQHERPKRSSWPASAVFTRPAPPPPFLHWVDRKLIASVLSTLVLCWLCIAMDLSASPQLPTTSAHLSTPASSSYHSIAVHSTVLDIDPVAEVMLMEFKVQQRGAELLAACSGAHAADLQLAVGTAEPPGARPAAVLPLCPRPANATCTKARSTAAVTATAAAGDASRGGFAVFQVPLPMRHSNMLASPWEEFAADIKLRLQCAGGACLQRSTPGVSWTAHWASGKMQLDVERHMPLSAVTLLDAAAAYPISEPSISTMEALGLHTPHPEASFRVEMRRHPGNRSLQLLVAVVQLMFILYCLMMGAGQVLWAYVMARFLCVRTHMTRQRTTLGGS